MTESLFEKYNNSKQEQFKDNQKLNELLSELKTLLTPVQKKVENKINNNKWPYIFIIGSPRSGTTLILQWLASLSCFSYPTNILTRFAYAPYLGAQIQKMLFDKEYDFNGDFTDIQSEFNFISDLGKSKGALATNEFQHFFRNYMPNFDPEFLNEEQLKKVDFEGINRGLSSIEYAFNKPFVTKLMMLQFNLSEVYQNIPKSFFIFVKRNSLFNMQSIFLARKKYYGSEKIWWSVKPKEYKRLKKLDVYHQIAGQVYNTNKSISDELNSFPEKSKLIINYEEFCANPEKIYQKLTKMLNELNYDIKVKYKGEKSFDIKNSIKLEEEIINKLKKAYQNLEVENKIS